jgi:hypothetical protein
VSYILAIESDPRQAAALAHVVKDRVSGAQLTIVDSKDGAIASINKRLPDLILVTALFSPREEEELIAHLRTLDGADHLQTLTIPLLAASDRGDGRSKRGLFGFKKKTEEVETQGCDPTVFAEQIVGYLKSVGESKANAEAMKIAAARAAERAAAGAGSQTQPQIDLDPGPQIYADPEPQVHADPQPQIYAEPAPERPLVGYTASSLGELLSKEEAVESGRLTEPEPAAPEPAIFGSVLFAKATPKREIKPFVEEPRPSEEPSVIVPPPAIEAVPAYEPVPTYETVPARETTPAYEPAPAYEPTPAYEPAPAYNRASAVEDVNAPAVTYFETPIPAYEPSTTIYAPEPPAPVIEPPQPVRLVQRLPPLAMWARLPDADGNGGSEAHSRSSNGKEAGELFDVLRIPPSIATITYPSGCRIRRVTAKPLSA